MLLSDLIALAPRDESLKALAAILDSLEEILYYASEGKAAFIANRRTQDAVMYRILCAGEAAKRFFDSYEGKDRPEGVGRLAKPNADVAKVGLSEDQWSGLITMRDALGHRIDEQDMAIVWRVVETEIPLMVQPVWDALKWASLDWLESERTPSRIRAKQKADQEMRELLETLTRSIRAIQSRNIEARLNEIPETYAKLIAAATHRVRDLDLPTDATSAEIALMGLLREIERQHKITAIAEHLEEVAWDESLESESSERGPRPVSDEVLTEDVSFDEDTCQWTANLVGTASYRDDEDDEVGCDTFEGTASGTISEDLDVEIDEWSWELQGNAAHDHENEPGWRG